MSPKPSVLLVNASPELTSVFQEHFGQAGFEAHAVHSAADALNWLAERTPDAVVVDLLLTAPELFSLLRRLHTGEAAGMSPVVVLTAPSAPAGKPPATPADYAALTDRVKQALSIRT